MSAAIIIIIFIIHVIAHSCTPSLIARWTRIHSFCYFLSLGRSHVSSRLTGACFQMLVFDSVQGSCLWPPEVGAGPQCDLGVRVLLSGSSIPSSSPFSPTTKLHPHMEETVQAHPPLLGSPKRKAVNHCHHTPLLGHVPSFYFSRFVSL